MLWYIGRGGAVAFLFFVFFKIIISHNIRQCVLIYFDIIFISFVVFRFLNMVVWFGLPCLGRCPLLGESTLFFWCGRKGPPIGENAIHTTSVPKLLHSIMSIIKIGLYVVSFYLWLLLSKCYYFN